MNTKVLTYILCGAAITIAFMLAFSDVGELKTVDTSTDSLKTKIEKARKASFEKKGLTAHSQ